MSGSSVSPEGGVAGIREGGGGLAGGGGMSGSSVSPEGGVVGGRDGGGLLVGGGGMLRSMPSSGEDSLSETSSASSPSSSM